MTTSGIEYHDKSSTKFTISLQGVEYLVTLHIVKLSVSKTQERKNTMAAVKTFELAPVYDTHKSFYGKAKVWKIGNSLILYSYDTVVARIENGEVTQSGLHRYSRTTDRHIREFIRQFAKEEN